MARRAWRQEGLLCARPLDDFRGRARAIGPRRRSGGLGDTHQVPPILAARRDTAEVP